MTRKPDLQNFVSMSRSLPSFLFIFFYSISSAFADSILPDTAANRSRGVVGCTQTSSGITCPGGGGGGSSDGSDMQQMQMDMMNQFMNGVMGGIQQGLQEQNRRARGEKRRLNADIQNFWDSKRNRHEREFREGQRKEAERNQEFRQNKNNMMGSLIDPGAISLQPRDPLLEEGRVLVHSPSLEKNAYGYNSLRTIEVPSPFGFKSEDEKRKQLAKLTDEQIQIEIDRTLRNLQRMQAEFQQDTLDLEHWLKESKEAEIEALAHSFNLVLNINEEEWGKAKDALALLKEAALKGSGFLKPGENEKVDYGAKAREAFLDLTGKMKDAFPKLMKKQMVKAVYLGDFAVEYSYQSTRWVLARQQILSINDNLGKANGKAKAQESLQNVLEDFMAEKNRRRTGSLVLGATQQGTSGP